MRCPNCGHPVCKTVETRGGDIAVWRRRRCVSCGRYFSTKESLTRETSYTATGYTPKRRRHEQERLARVDGLQITGDDTGTVKGGSQ